MNTLKVGIDIHGVGDTIPELFEHLASNKNVKVYILTGKQLSVEFLTYINKLNFNQVEVFSISDHLLKSGVPVKWKDKQNPVFDDILWNKAKAEFCNYHDIDIMLDDSIEYAKYFKDIKTKFILIHKI